MSENQEKIESRLCGYVDDTLDPSERAEIEAHLQTHPQHRQLLAQLRMMRDALRDLPRESAPGEMSESFTGQLERSVLLEGIHDQPAPRRMRITRRPQLAAAAAIILLAGGLAAVIYFAQPRNKSSQVAQNTNPSGTGVIPSATPQGPAGDEDLTAAKDRLAAARSHFPSPEAGRAGNAGATPDFKGPTNLTPTTTLADKTRQALFLSANKADPALVAAANSALAGERVKSLLGTGDGGADEGNKRGVPARPVVVMVVSTADIPAASRQLEEYLQTTHADWQPTVEESAGSDAVAQNQKEAKTYAGTSGSLNDHAKAGDGNKAQSRGVLKQEHPTTQPQTQPSDVVASADATHGAQAANGAGQEQQGAVADAPHNSADHALAAAQRDELSSAAGRCVVVHNLSFQQAAKLSDTLRQSNPGTQAPLFADDSAYVAAEKAVPPVIGSSDSQTGDDGGAGATTKPALSLQAGQEIKLRQVDANFQQFDRTAGPTTKPAGAQLAAKSVVGVDRDSLLGSTPVDLVIVVQNTATAVAAVPASPAQAAPAPGSTTQPAHLNNPTTAPSTQPATQPGE